MPEGPEIYYLCEMLKNELLNRELISIIKKDKKIDINKKINKIECKGKHIWFECGDVYVHIHMGLNGWIGNKDSKYIKYIIKLDDRYIYIEDKIKLSRIEILDKVNHEDKINKLGVDILSKEFKIEVFKDLIGKYNSKICIVLLKQDLICSIGNYIKNESLYHAHINPERKTNTLTDNELIQLFNSIRYVYFSRLIELLKSNKKLKITKDIKMLLPNKLTIPYIYNVYDRKTDLYGNKVIYKNIGGRGTYYVEEIQK